MLHLYMSVGGHVPTPCQHVSFVISRVAFETSRTLCVELISSTLEVGGKDGMGCSGRKSTGIGACGSCGRSDRIELEKSGIVSLELRLE